LRKLSALPRPFSWIVGRALEREERGTGGKEGGRRAKGERDEYTSLLYNQSVALAGAA